MRDEGIWESGGDRNLEGFEGGTVGRVVRGR